MSNSPEKTVQVYCGELCHSAECSPDEINLINYKVNGLDPNITIGYEGFVYDPATLSDRILDLLQISAVVFCADRMVRRGERTSISNQGWARSFVFHISVLDYNFWTKDTTIAALTAALTFMTGDRSYEFDFHKADKGHFEEKKLQQLSLFPKEADRVIDIDNYDVMLFSGGLDSLAGLLEELCINNRKVIAVSHRSNNVVIHIQQELIKKLNEEYEHRIVTYGFSCHNRGIPSVEETQRTRMFLFSAIAFAICQCFGKHRFYVYENGVTSLNFPVQTDVINARASRTTHPKTLGLLQKLYSLFDESFEIIAPYYLKTKEDIVNIFKQINRLDLIASAVSCSSTRTKHSICPHCGCCSQCIDRRFAIFAAGLSEYDAEYAEDFNIEIKDEETRQRLYQQMRFASGKDLSSAFDMMKNFYTETNNAVEFWPCDNPEDSIYEIYELLKRYGDSVIRAVKQIQLKYDDLRNPITEKSFLKIISSRDYLKSPFERRASEINDALQRGLPIMFKTEKPKNENDFNNKVVALLSTGNERWTREYPIISFGITNYRADSSCDGLIIESKYIRGTTTPNVVTNGIASDLMLINENQNVIFVVYDPEHKVDDDQLFCNSFMEKKKNCIVYIYR